MIAIACDHGGLELKRVLCRWMDGKNIRYEDLGTDSTASVDYPVFAHRLAAGVAGGTWEKGVLVCGTGLGMSMAANRHRGIRAAVCTDPYTAEMARRHNEANVLCMGGRMVGPMMAERILETFLLAEFEGDRHSRRIALIETDVKD